MVFLTIIQHYLLWHYTHAYAEMFHVFKNFLWFLGHFFSLRTLTLSLFTPFKRITDEGGRAWNFEDFVGRIVINLISRIIGALLRGTLLVIGLISLLATTVLGGVIYALWFIAPVLIIVSITTGIVYLFI